MPNKKNAKRKGKGFLSFLPLILSLPGVAASVLALLLPFAVRLTKNPLTEKYRRERMTLSEWGKQHDGLFELDGKGFAFFSETRGFVWTVAVLAGVVLITLLVSRFVRRSKDLSRILAMLGVLLTLCAVVCFVFAVLFSASASNDGTRVLLTTGAFLPLIGGVLNGIVTFFAVRREL